MRSSKSRSRGKNRGANRSPANNINRVFDSSGPEGKVRGTPQQIIDKYAQLSRDAFLAGDRVAGENFQQHAEHYTRLLSEAQRDADEKRQQSDNQPRDRQPQKQRDRDTPRDGQPGQSGQRDRTRDANPSQPETETPPQERAADVVDLGDTDTASDSGLVETPEEQPRKKTTRTRKPRSKTPKPEAADDAPAEAGSAPSEAGSAPSEAGTADAGGEKTTETPDASEAPEAAAS